MRLISNLVGMVAAYYGSYFFVKFLVSESPRVVNFFVVIFGYFFGIIIGCSAIWGTNILMCETVLGGRCKYPAVLIDSITWGIIFGILWGAWGIRKGWTKAKYGHT